MKSTRFKQLLYFILSMSYIFSINAFGSSPKLDTKIHPSDKTASKSFGNSVDIFENIVIVGAHADDEKASNSGAAYIYEKDLYGSWKQQKITAQDASTKDFFGIRVATTGKFAFISAYGNNESRGAVYVFERLGFNNWQQRQKLTYPKLEKKDFFGISLAVENNVLLVGASGVDGKHKNSGAAYVFKYKNKKWSFSQKLMAKKPQLNEFFGYSVALQNKTAAIGAYGNSHKGSRSGAVYLFTSHKKQKWQQRKRLIAADAKPKDHFGSSLIIQNSQIFVGAYGNADSAGAVYLFNSQRPWRQQQKLTLFDQENKQSRFGFSLSANKSHLIVGAHLEDLAAKDIGSAYYFTRSDKPDSPWQATHRLYAADGDAYDNFGWSVKIDNEKVVVGSPADDHDKTHDVGSIYIFSGIKPNAPPNAVIRKLERAQTYTPIKLDGTGSHDDYTTPESLHYEWAMTSQQKSKKQEPIKLIRSHTAHPVFSPKSPGVYTANLRVRDESNTWSSRITQNIRVYSKIIDGFIKDGLTVNEGDDVLVTEQAVISGDIRIRGGKVTITQQAEIKGAISVYQQGELYINSQVSIQNGIRARNAKLISIKNSQLGQDVFLENATNIEIDSSTFSSLTISEASNVNIANNSISGNARVIHSTQVKMNHNEITGNLRLLTNRHTEAMHNAISGSLKLKAGKGRCTAKHNNVVEDRTITCR